MKYLSLIIVVLLFGCSTSTSKPAFFEKSYFANIYIERWFEPSRHYPNDNGYRFDGDKPFSKVLYEQQWVNGKLYRYPNSFIKGYALENYILAIGPSFDILYFYQDKEKNCFLYSYNKKEIQKMKTGAGFSLRDKNVIFLIERNSLRVVSRDEYERIKPTLKLSDYDPSACKPKPNDL